MIVCVQKMSSQNMMIQFLPYNNYNTSCNSKLQQTSCSCCCCSSVVLPLSVLSRSKSIRISPMDVTRTRKKRRDIILFTVTTFLFNYGNHSHYMSWSKPTMTISDFVELPDSGGVKALDLRIGNDDGLPAVGDKVIIHYYGRLAAKQGWRFDSTYDHKDEHGVPLPFEFVLGSGNVISGIESSVRSMKVGGIRRVIIPPSQGYQNTSQEPIPPNFFDRQRLFTTIFNPTRMANGEGSTLGTLVFDIELIGLRHHK